MIIASGNVSDSPFARTFFSLGAKRFTGDLILEKNRKEYRTSWEGGQIVAASSPSPADAPGRIALAEGMVNSTTLGVFVQKCQEDPIGDPLSILVEVAKLSDAQLLTLKSNLLARAAARTFALPDADFKVDNARSMSADPKIPPLDPRKLMYLGLKTHYSLERLRKEMSAVGQRGLKLQDAAVAHIPSFGFGDEEQPVVTMLLSSENSLHNLVQKLPSVDESTTACVVYALMATGYLAYGQNQAPLEAQRAPASKPVPAPPIPRAPAAQQPQAPAEPTSKPAPAPTAAAAPTPASKPASKPAPEADSPEAQETLALIQERARLLQGDCNHYQLLGIEPSAAEGEIRSAYFKYARQLHPDRLNAIGVRGVEDEAQEVFAAINKAFAVLGNKKGREHYKEVLKAGGEKAYEAKQQEAEQMAMKILRAEEHYHFGEMALRRDQYAKAAEEFKKALDLNPEESEYLALHTWASYCASSDRSTLRESAISNMSSAVLKSPNNATTRLYHAKLMKLAGRVPEAIDSFEKLLQMQPKNGDAQLELKLLKEQKAGPATAEADKSKGLFGRKK